MIHTKIIVQKIAEKLHGRGFYRKQMTHPLRDWAIGLSFFILLLVCGGAYSTYNFIKYQNVYQSNESDAPITISYDDGKAKRALTLYGHKETTHRELQSNSVPPPVLESDPQETVQTASSTLEVIQEMPESVEIEMATTSQATLDN